MNFEVTQSVCNIEYGKFSSQPCPVLPFPFFLLLGNFLSPQSSQEKEARYKTKKFILGAVEKVVDEESGSS